MSQTKRESLSQINTRKTPKKKKRQYIVPKSIHNSVNVVPLTLSPIVLFIDNKKETLSHDQNWINNSLSVLDSLPILTLVVERDSCWFAQLIRWSTSFHSLHKIKNCLLVDCCCGSCCFCGYNRVHSLDSSSTSQLNIVASIAILERECSPLESPTESAVGFPVYTLRPLTARSEI